MTIEITDYGVTYTLLLLACVGAGLLGALLGEALIRLAENLGWISQRHATLKLFLSRHHFDEDDKT